MCRALLGPFDADKKDERGRNDERSTQGLHTPGGDQDPEGARQPACKRRDGEDDKPDQAEDAWPPPRELRGRDGCGGEDQVVGDQHPGDLGDAHVEARQDVRQRQRHHRRVGENERHRQPKRCRANSGTLHPGTVRSEHPAEQRGVSAAATPLPPRRTVASRGSRAGLAPEAELTLRSPPALPVLYLSPVRRGAIVA